VIFAIRAVVRSTGGDPGCDPDAAGSAGTTAYLGRDPVDYADQLRASDRLLRELKTEVGITGKAD
jgi:hypothetical protein